jgi:hypothetical protein
MSSRFGRSLYERKNSVLVVPLINIFIEKLIWAAFLSHHPSVANCFMVELTVLKEMTQVLADLFGLKL